MLSINNYPLIVETKAYPSFFISLKSEDREKEGRITRIWANALFISNRLFQSLKTGTYETLTYAPRSFFYIVFNYKNNELRAPSNLALACYKTMYWAFICLPCTFATASYRSLFADDNMKRTYLKYFVPQDIDLAHMMQAKIEIVVPKEAQEFDIGNLREIFQQIHFDDPTHPTYITSLPENASPQDLANYLETLITHIKTRKAFLGTPPEYDLVALNRFYEQIENAIKAAVYQVTQSVKNFEETHNIENLQEDGQREYKNLLEDRSRLLVDLAIAGRHCGARLLGEAMNGYYRHCSLRSDSNESLQNILADLLAKKRLEIATSHAGSNTHEYNTYMQHVGSLLGIPGTENIVEHLAAAPNVAECLRNFFQEYTEQCIKDTIQEHIQKDGSLQEKVIDWLKTQRKNWEPYHQEATPAELVNQIEQIIEKKEQVDVSDYLEIVDDFIHLPKQDKPSQSWDEFIDQQFASETAKEFFERKYLGLSKPQILRKRHLTKEFLKTKILADHFLATASWEDSLKGLPSVLKNIKAVRQVQDIVPLPAATCLRIVQRQIPIEETILHALEQDKDLQFISQLNIEEIPKKGLPPRILEWLLIKHEVFTSPACLSDFEPTIDEIFRTAGDFSQIMEFVDQSESMQEIDQKIRNLLNEKFEEFGNDPNNTSYFDHLKHQMMQRQRNPLELLIHPISKSIILKKISSDLNSTIFKFIATIISLYFINKNLNKMNEISPILIQSITQYIRNSEIIKKILANQTVQKIEIVARLLRSYSWIIQTIHFFGAVGILPINRHAMLLISPFLFSSDSSFFLKINALWKGGFFTWNLCSTIGSHGILLADRMYVGAIQQDKTEMYQTLIYQALQLYQKKQASREEEELTQQNL